VLDQLARHYHVSFADQWDFVDYVHQQKLGVDLTTSPTRSRMLPKVPGRHLGGSDWLDAGMSAPSSQRSGTRDRPACGDS
jgi:hypothetical protein